MEKTFVAIIMALCVSAFPAQAADDRVDTLKDAMADKSFSIAGAKVIEDLVAKGLSYADSEKVVRTAFLDTSSCLVDAAIAQAEVQEVPMDDVLDALELTIRDIDSPADDSLTRGLLNEEEIGNRAAPCILDVAQKAGIVVQ